LPLAGVRRLWSEIRADSFGLAPEGKISIAYGTLSVAIQDSAERARAKFWRLDALNKIAFGIR
jgi:hypothetical protein